LEEDDDDLVVKATKKPRDQHKSPITKTAAYIFSLEKEKKRKESISSFRKTFPRDIVSFSYVEILF